MSKIFTQDAIDRLRSNVENERNINQYGKTKFFIETSDLIEAEIISNLPSLKPPPLLLGGPADNDFDNSVTLYNSFKKIPRNVASDPRLWIYLCHCPKYFQLIQKRWKLSGLDFEKYYEYSDGSEDRTKIKNRIIRAFFCTMNSRHLQRNAIAGLWWGANLTFSPWREDKYFSDFKDKDDFYFTQILFSNTDIYESLLGRSNTHDIRLLCTVLDVIHENKLKRDEWRNLQKRISALMVVSSFDFDSYKESKNKIESLIVT